MLRFAYKSAAAIGVGLGVQAALRRRPKPNLDDSKAEDVDALIIGGGIMGATVALMIKLLQPDWKVKLVEQHNRVGLEASNEWHNAGTGHAALCEPNYTPYSKDGKTVEIDKAVATNNKFMTSLAFWSFLVEKSILPDATFIQPAPHILFVHGEEKREWLKRRVEKLSKLPAFAATEYSEDYDTIQKWSGLLCNGRPRSGGEVIAASRHPDGTEVNYGLLTRHLVQSFGELGGDVQLLSTVTALRQQTDKRWLVAVHKADLTDSNQVVRARFVFAGGGGGSLSLLQMAGIPEIQGYGGMPVSGKFLVCQKLDVVEQNLNKVYGPAAVSAPPMSVPHIDFRSLYGKDVIFFGPFAGFSPMLFKVSGTPLDWLATINWHNVLPMAKMAMSNLPLVKYLIEEIFASKGAQLEALREFYPAAKPEDWTMVWAGQRIQIVNPKGELQFGTEVLSSKDGTLVGLLGASPGASVSPQIALEVINKFDKGANSAFQWHLALSKWIPCYGRDVNKEPGLYDQIMRKARKVLLAGNTAGYRSSRVNTAHLFDLIDLDHDGTLTMKEVSKYLLGQGMAKEQIQALVNALDTDKSGTISRQEFDEGFGKVVSSLLPKSD